MLHGRGGMTAQSPCWVCLPISENENFLQHLGQPRRSKY